METERSARQGGRSGHRPRLLFASRSLRPARFGPDGAGRPAGLLENAQKAIGELIDQLKAKNLGGQATKVLIKHRWMRDHTPPDPTPADLQRATAVYKELKALLQGGEAG